MEAPDDRHHGLAGLLLEGEGGQRPLGPVWPGAREGRPPRARGAGGEGQEHGQYENGRREEPASSVAPHRMWNLAFTTLPFFFWQRYQEETSFIGTHRLSSLR